MRLLNWNLEFAPPGGARGRVIDEIIRSHEADVVCLTEAHETWPEGDGHWIWSDPDDGYEGTGTRRKVGLWSRRPWSDVDVLGHPSLPGGRFVAGATDTPVGPVRIVGVCIPWRAAHVPTGRRDRAPWEDHVAYLDALAARIPGWLDAGPVVVAGDFNQRIPRRYAPVEVHEALLRAFAPLTIVTTGDVPGLDRPVIDHVALGTGLQAGAVSGISRFDGDRRLTDHDGVVVDLAPD